MEWLAVLHVWLPLAIGWFIVHRLSAARDMDKARREMAAQVADDLVEVATSIFLAAQRYHTNKRERENERRLKIDLQDMGMRVQQLVETVDEPSKIRLCSVSIAEFRQSITAHHFESEHIDALNASSLQMAEIADAYLQLKRALFSLKLSQFPKRRNRWFGCVAIR